MSASRSSSEGSDFHNSFDENSDGGCGSAASSLAPHQGRPKRTRQTQIRGKTWVFRGEINTNMQQYDSDHDNIDTVVNEETPLFRSIKSQLHAALGSKFEIMFGNLFSSVSYFVIFCNLINILDVGPAATKVKIQIRGFLQMGNTKAKTALDKLLSPSLSQLLQGEWERCDGALSGNQEYADCLHTNSPWLPIQSTGVYRESNQAKCAKRRQLTTAPVFSSDFLSTDFFKTNVEIRKTDPSSARRRARRKAVPLPLRAPPPPPYPPLP